MHRWYTDGCDVTRGGSARNHARQRQGSHWWGHDPEAGNKGPFRSPDECASLPFDIPSEHGSFPPNRSDTPTGAPRPPDCARLELRPIAQRPQRLHFDSKTDAAWRCTQSSRCCGSSMIGSGTGVRRPYVACTVSGICARALLRLACADPGCPAPASPHGGCGLSLSARARRDRSAQASLSLLGTVRAFASIIKPGTRAASLACN